MSETSSERWELLRDEQADNVFKAASSIGSVASIRALYDDWYSQPAYDVDAPVAESA